MVCIGCPLVSKFLGLVQHFYETSTAVWLLRGSCSEQEQTFAWPRLPSLFYQAERALRPQLRTEDAAGQCTTLPFASCGASPSYGPKTTRNLDPPVKYIDFRPLDGPRQ